MKRFAPVLLLLLLPAIGWTQAHIDRALGTFRVQEDALYLWSGRQVKMMVPGFEGLAAGVYWLRTVQYFGGQLAFGKSRDFKLLAPLIDITTTLDPRLEIAYRYGATFLAEPPPIGAGRPQEAVALLERGVRANPLSWRLGQELAFVHFIFLKDPVRASEILMETSTIPGAAFWLKTLAADILRKGGEREISRRVWMQIYDEAEDGALKNNARDRLLVLDALDAADRLTESVKEFERRAGRTPRDLHELLASGLAKGPLVDATGVPFEYDPGVGQVRVSTQSSLWRPE